MTSVLAPGTVDQITPRVRALRARTAPRIGMVVGFVGDQHLFAVRVVSDP